MPKPVAVDMGAWMRQVERNISLLTAKPHPGSGPWTDVSSDITHTGPAGTVTAAIILAGRTASMRGRLAITGAGQVATVSLRHTITDPAGSVLGAALWTDASTGVTAAATAYWNGTTMAFTPPPFTVAAGDSLSWRVTYEVS